ncbi:hypothetical protein PENTCL1PPCAC_12431, partial [Pristionchus entomophagus]
GSVIPKQEHEPVDIDKRGFHTKQDDNVVINANDSADELRVIIPSSEDDKIERTDTTRKEIDRSRRQSVRFEGSPSLGIVTTIINAIFETVISTINFIF